jgi:hypothetical protein
MATQQNRSQARLASANLSHHLNAYSKARHPSPLKDIIKFMGYDGMVSLAGGMLFMVKHKAAETDHEKGSRIHRSSLFKVLKFGRIHTT